jgi:hypothetical protein
MSFRIESEPVFRIKRGPLRIPYPSYSPVQLGGISEGQTVDVIDEKGYFWATVSVEKGKLKIQEMTPGSVWGKRDDEGNYSGNVYLSHSPTYEPQIHLKEV